MSVIALETENDSNVHLPSDGDESPPEYADKTREIASLDSIIQIPTKKTPFLQFKKLWLFVTLEPMLFLKMIAESNLRVLADTLEIDRVCRINLNFSKNDCLAMDDGNHSDIQNAVQVYQNTFNYYQNLIDSILPVVVILFAGSLSDRYGRKLPLATVLAGFVAFSVIYIVTALNPNWPVEVLYAATIAVDVTGSWVVFNMAVYSYMADVVPVEARTKRMGWLDAVWYLGGPIGTWLGGWLYHSYGYVTVFAVSGVLWSFCLLYVVFVVKETIVPSEAIDSSSSAVRCDIIADLGRTAVQSYPLNGRFHLYSLMALKLGVFLSQGHQLYLWARRVLSWNASQYSTWSGADEAVHQVGMVLWVGVASFYHYSDHTVAIIGLVSIGLWSVTLACVTGPGVWWLTILASLLGSLEASVQPALRTLITSIPLRKNVGKVLALLGLMESIWLTVDRSLYTYLYNTFVSTFPQINFVVQSGNTSMLIMVLIVLKFWIARSTTDLGSRIPTSEQAEA